VIEDITAVFVLPGFRVLNTELADGELTLLVETPRELVGCRCVVRSPGSRIGGR